MHTKWKDLSRFLGHAEEIAFAVVHKSVRSLHSMMYAKLIKLAATLLMCVRTENAFKIAKECLYDDCPMYRRKFN
jgi:hypothetical protein